MPQISQETISTPNSLSHRVIPPKLEVNYVTMFEQINFAFSHQTALLPGYLEFSDWTNSHLRNIIEIQSENSKYLFKIICSYNRNSYSSQAGKSKHFLSIVGGEDSHLTLSR